VVDPLALPPTIVPSPNHVPYIVAVVAMMAFGVGGAVAIVLAKAEGSLLLIGALFGFLAPTTLSLLAFMKAQETHLSVNSRLDAFIENAQAAARAEGRDQGRTQGRQDAEARTDVLSTRQP
jgi:hypothetical protein